MHVCIGPKGILRHCTAQLTSCGNIFLLHRGAKSAGEWCRDSGIQPGMCNVEHLMIHFYGLTGGGVTSVGVLVLPVI